MVNSIKDGLGLALSIIVILEILRYIRLSKNNNEIEELRKKVKSLEEKLKEK